MSFLELKGIEKYYHKGEATEVHALKDVALSVEKGEMIALMGVSGSGKSTLLHVLGLMDRFDAGQYFFDGNDVAALNGKQLAQYRNEAIGFVMQNFGLVLYQTVYWNVALPLMLNRKTKYRAIKPIVQGLLEDLGIADKAHVTVDSLSGGQQQRVAIARAMANSPALLIADEPTGALDSQTAQEVMRIFDRLNREKQTTVVIATHDANVAKQCARTVTIFDGEIK